MKIKQDGSILILTLLALVGALSISVAMVSISVVERSMTAKSKKSVTAFQSANSGIEWALKKINDAQFNSGNKKVQTIADVFGVDALNPQTGKISCPSNFFNNKSNCEVYLLTGPNDNRTVIVNGNTTMDKIVAVRATGVYGEAEEKVGRALEAYAMPNCGSDYERVADFCVGKELNGSEAWTSAIGFCAGAGKRLCTAAELLAVSSVAPSGLTDDVGSDDEWTADVVDSSSSIYIDNSGAIQSDSSSDSKKFRCCMNR